MCLQLTVDSSKNVSYYIGVKISYKIDYYIYNMYYIYSKS